MPWLRWTMAALLLAGQGCALPEAARESFATVKHFTLGEHYLDARRYREGLARFSAEVQADPTDHRARYYLGRFQLAEGQTAEALPQFREAVRLAPDNPDYHFWRGVAEAANGHGAEERRSYQKALELEPNHAQARIYLAHNLFDAHAYQQALEQYQWGLRLDPHNPQALYNRALSLGHLKRTPEELSAWRLYLADYPTGAHARQAAHHLNTRGVFDYRNYFIGRRTITLPRIRFEPFSATLTAEDRESLAYLASIVNRLPDWTLQVVAYQKNNGTLAEARAKQIKAFLAGQAPQSRQRIRVSWFDVPQTITMGSQRFTEDASIHFFTTRP
jgi:tetratricopeptide (TPR) repeat protein